VVINGQESSWSNINAGVPQGSILGPLLFLVFINDIVNEVNCQIKLFADDTSIYAIVDNPLVASITLNSDFDRIQKWADKWLVNFNPKKTKSMIISRKKDLPYHPPLIMERNVIKTVDSHKHLGLIFSSDGNWNIHIDEILAKASVRLNMLRRLKFKADRKTLEVMYFSYVRPILEYVDVIWDNCPEYLKDRLESINYEAARIVTGATKLTSIHVLMKESGWESLRDRRKNHKLIMFHQMVNKNTPDYLTNLVPSTFGQTHSYGTRNSYNLPSIYSRTNFHHNSFIPSTVRLWNELPIHIRTASLYSLKFFLQNKRIVPQYFYSGSRIGQILHTRIRTESSGLKEHLFKKNLVDDPYCICKQIESSEHFLLYCPLYRLIRQNMINNISCQATTQNLLFGNPLLSDIENKQNFIIIQDFIVKSKRFA